MTNGEVLRVRAAMKPISTVPRALATVDIATGEPARRDQPAQRRLRGAPRAASSMEAMVALVLADAVLEKFGGDSVAETRRNVQAYLDAPRRPVTGPLLVLVGPPASGKTTVGHGASPHALGVAVPRHRRTTSRSRPARTVADLFVDARRAALPRAGGAGGGPRRWPSTTACSPSAAAR